MATAAVAVFVQRSTGCLSSNVVGHAAPLRETLGTAAGTAIACNRGWPWATYEDEPGCGEMEDFAKKQLVHRTYPLVISYIAIENCHRKNDLPIKKDVFFL